MKKILFLKIFFFTTWVFITGIEFQKEIFAIEIFRPDMDFSREF